jgi:hypothetical protein
MNNKEEENVNRLVYAYRSLTENEKRLFLQKTCSCEQDNDGMLIAYPDISFFFEANEE